MSRDAIKAKIEKLLELAKRGGTAAEAALAAEKAAELMAQYGISYGDLGEKNVRLDADDRDESWKGVILHGVAALYAVLDLRTSDGSLKLVGPKVRVEVAGLMYGYLIGAVKHENRRAVPSGMTQRDRAIWRKDFRNTAAHRLQKRLLDKVRAMSQAGVEGSTALVVADYFKQEQARIAESIGGVKPGGEVALRTRSAEAMVAGDEAGKRIGLDEQVGGRSETLRLTHG